MSAGTISAMISSLKSNNRLRRNKESYRLFHKKIEFNDSILVPLSQEENQLIVEGNKRLYKQQLRRKKTYALFLISFYVAVFLVALYILVL